VAGATYFGTSSLTDLFLASNLFEGALRRKGSVSETPECPDGPESHCPLKPQVIKIEPASVPTVGNVHQRLIAASTAQLNVTFFSNSNQCKIPGSELGPAVQVEVMLGRDRDKIIGGMPGHMQYLPPVVQRIQIWFIPRFSLLHSGD